MSIYTFLEIEGKKIYDGCTAHVLNDNGVKTVLNGFLFKGIPENSLCFLEYDPKKGHTTTVITEEEAVVIRAREEAEYKARMLEIERIKKERIASGRWIYETAPGYPAGEVAEVIREILTTDISKFPQAMTDRVNQKRSQWSSALKIPLTVEQVIEFKRYKDFLNLAQEDDRLEWQSWDSGFLAYNAGFAIAREGKVIYYLSEEVS